MKRLFLLLILVLTLNGKSVTILTTSDLQSTILPYKTKQGEFGGLAKIKTIKRQYKGKGDVVILVSTGDDLFGPFYTIFHGKPEMEGMSLTGYDVVCPGNHEFDYGLEIYKDALKFAKFDVVCSNLSFQDQFLKGKIRPWVIKSYDGLKIGFFGLMTPELFRVTNPGKGIYLDKNLIDVSKNMVKLLQGKGCDLIIALTHIGFDLDRQIAENVDGIDVIVGGHDHEFIFKKVRNTYIVHDGVKGKFVGALSFDYEGKMRNVNWNLIPVDSTVEADTSVNALMTKYWNTYEAKLNTKIGYTKVPLDARKAVVRTRESNLGDLIADSWLSWFKDADAALVSGGSIRGDRIYPAGPITYKTVNSILPFRNEIMEVELTGDELKRVLEISASALRVKGDGVPDSCRASSGGVLQISGLRIKIDTTKPSFSAIYKGRKAIKILNTGYRIVQIFVRKDGRWQKIKPEATYKVLINKWMSRGGDGYYIFLNKNCINTTVITADVLIKYIKSHKTISPTTDGRIKIIP